MATIEEKLGELSGIIKGLPAILERLEGRQEDTRDKVITIKTELKGLSEEFTSLDKSFEAFRKDAYQREELRTREIDKLRSDVEVLKRTSASLSKKVWEILKYLLALGLGAGAAAFSAGSAEGAEGASRLFGG